MATSTPTRTPAGEDELRHRTRKLGQRYRTVLLLVDGRRPLAELLSLAQQAGAAVSHFEELVQLGLVELPVEAPAPGAAPASEAPQNAAGASAAVETTTPAAAPEDDERDISPTLPMADLAPAPEPVASPRPPAPGVEIELGAVTEETPEERLLQQVRDLLIDTLRIDSPLFGARTFFRVRSAQSTSELIELVWEIEDHITRTRHTRDELISLQRARELLGMGNTRVAGETRPGMLPE